MYQSYRIKAFLGAFTGEGRNDVNYVFFQIRDMMMQSRFIGAGAAAQMDSNIAVSADYIVTFLAVHFGYAAVILMAALFTGLIGKIFHMAFKQKNELGMMMACGSGMVFLYLQCCILWRILPFCRLCQVNCLSSQAEHPTWQFPLCLQGSCLVYTDSKCSA